MCVLRRQIVRVHFGERKKVAPMVGWVAQLRWDFSRFGKEAEWLGLSGALN